MLASLCTLARVLVYFSLEMLYCPTPKKKFLLYGLSIPYFVPKYPARVYHGIMIRWS